MISKLPLLACKYFVIKALRTRKGSRCVMCFEITLHAKDGRWVSGVSDALLNSVLAVGLSRYFFCVRSGSNSVVTDIQLDWVVVLFMRSSGSECTWNIFMPLLGDCSIFVYAYVYIIVLLAFNRISIITSSHAPSPYPFQH